MAMTDTGQQGEDTHVFSGLDVWSFKGASFLFLEGHKTGGLKVIQHDLLYGPEREVVGELPQIHYLRGRIKGMNYDFDKRALIKALTDKGIGTLVRPFFGSVEVIATGYTVTDTANNLYMAEFSMTFLEPKKNLKKSLIHDL